MAFAPPEYKAGWPIDEVGRRKIDEQLTPVPLIKGHFAARESKRKRLNDIDDVRDNKRVSYRAPIKLSESCSCERLVISQCVDSEAM
jgi:hypothetical protein